MKGVPKAPKIAGAIRAVLAANLAKLLERDFKLDTNKSMALAKKTGLAQYTVQRALKGSHSGSNIDTIEVLAKVFDLAVYQLLVPGLDVFTPQTIQDDQSGPVGDLARIGKHLSSANLPRLIGYADSLLAAQNEGREPIQPWQNAGTVVPWDGRERRKTPSARTGAP